MSSPAARATWQDDEQRGRVHTFDYEATWQINDHQLAVQLQYEHDDRREQLFRQ